MNAEKNIVVIQYQPSVTLKVMVRKLGELGYQADVIGPDYELVKECLPMAALFILYLPRDMTEGHDNLGNLEQICEAIQAGGKKILVAGDVGEKGNRSVWVTKYPVLRNYAWMDRPHSAGALRYAMEAFLKGAAVERSQRKILIVDDDPSYAGMVREWIKADYKAYVVTAGMQAINFLLKNRVDLILLDYEMPVVNGQQLLQMLRQEPETRDIPVIFLTGVGTQEEVLGILALKPKGYILKSTTKDKLLEYIANAFKSPAAN